MNITGFVRDASKRTDSHQISVQTGTKTGTKHPSEVFEMPDSSSPLIKMKPLAVLAIVIPDSNENFQVLGIDLGFRKARFAQAIFQNN